MSALELKMRSKEIFIFFLNSKEKAMKWILLTKLFWIYMAWNLLGEHSLISFAWEMDGQRRVEVSNNKKNVTRSKIEITNWKPNYFALPPFLSSVSLFSLPPSWKLQSTSFRYDWECIVTVSFLLLLFFMSLLFVLVWLIFWWIFTFKNARLGDNRSWIFFFFFFFRILISFIFMFLFCCCSN